MLNFRSYIQLDERVLSPGLNPEHEKFREQYRNQIHDIIQKSYSHPSIGGYGGLQSGSPEESKAIHADISNSLIKMTRRGGDKISSVALYKKQFGRKAIAFATDGTPQGKADYLKNSLEDHEMKRAWAEVSGAPEKISMKMGQPVIPVEKMRKITGKQLTPVGDTGHYERSIGGHPHVKIGMGHPKES